MVTKPILLDTDILIDFLRTGSGQYLDILKYARDEAEELYLSTVTVYEIFAGISSIESGDKIAETFANFNILPFNYELSKFTGELQRDNNLTIALADLIIAASALSLKARLATRNLKHFQGIPNLKFFSLSG